MGASTKLQALVVDDLLVRLLARALPGSEMFRGYVERGR